MSVDEFPLSKMTISGNNEFVCEGCEQGFDQVEVFIRHRAQYQDFHSFCSNCNSFYTNEHKCENIISVTLNDSQSESVLNDDQHPIRPVPDKDIRRKKTRRGQRSVLRLQCKECVLSFPKQDGLEFHVRSVHKKQRRCYTCEEEFSTKSEYWEHIRLHDPNDKIVCKECLAEFSTMNQFRTHVRCYPGPHNFKCKMCLREFKTESRLDEHVCVCANGEALLCACGREFVTYPSLVEHARGTRPFCCCSCLFTTPNLTCYIRHLRKHSNQKPYQCDTCGVHFSMFEMLKNHIKTVHNDQSERDVTDVHKDRIPCPDCNKAFRPERLEKHRAKHKRSSSLCPDCGRLFESHLRLSQHLANAHKCDPVTCEHCGKTLKTKKILLEHLKTHWITEVGSRVAQAICPMCGLELAQKGSLSRHILLVHERHKLVVDETPVICKECGITLPNKAKYYTHRRQHRAMVERFRCTFCSREFNKKQNLIRHIYLLHNSLREVKEPSYGCNCCSRFFRERKNLSRHYRLVHKMSDLGVNQ